MPIISFNVSDSLKKFLKKMVSRKEYKNSSNVIRDALIRLMDEKNDGTELDVDMENDAISKLDELIPVISSTIMMTYISNNEKLEKKINKLELTYHENIINKSIFSHDKLSVISYFLEGRMNVVQAFITEMNAFEELKSFRYVINEPED